MLTRMLQAGCLSVACVACSSSDRSLTGDEIPPSLTQACDAPVNIPERDITAVEVEILWGRDRAALRDCGSRHDGLTNVVFVRTE